MFAADVAEGSDSTAEQVLAVQGVPEDPGEFVQSHEMVAEWYHELDKDQLLMSVCEDPSTTTPSLVSDSETSSVYSRESSDVSDTEQGQ